MFITGLALTLMWVGGICSYLSNDKQSLLKNKLSPVIGWVVLIGAIFFSSMLFSQFYAPVTSVIFSIGALLFNWILITLLAGHWPQKPISVSAVGLVFVVLFAQFGGA
ncbi:hypothetical protein ACMAZF_03430 [Psychrobium sp. nBUS_13]|uniref:hypothetical protein n=1 Tax=Psychrobium sp. nBUS_13 TaxID=3395319 RepID=UPI003EBD5A39